MGCTEDSPEEAELVALTDVIASVEAARAVVLFAAVGIARKQGVPLRQTPLTRPILLQRGWVNRSSRVKPLS